VPVAEDAPDPGGRLCRLGSCVSIRNPSSRSGPWSRCRPPRTTRRCDHRPSTRRCCPFGELSPPAFERLVAAVVLYVDGLQQVIPEVTMILRLTRGRRKISGCARDDAGRSVVPVSPF
jgi:hypothetical protein